MKKLNKQQLTEIEALGKMDDSEIDLSDIPEMGEEFFKNAVLLHRSKKIATSIRYDQDILNFFKKQGQGWQTKMNDVLKTYVSAQEANNNH